MSQWPYIIAAYAIGILGTLALAGWSWWRMKRAEAQAENLRGRPPAPFVSSEVETRFSTTLETNGPKVDSQA